MLKVFFIMSLWCGLSNATDIAPMNFPVFLKYGYSTILDFNNTPTEVIIGDRQSFQIEKLKKSIVIKPLENEAVTNMFVYFKTSKPKVFTLTASDEANPVFYKKIKDSYVPKIKKSTLKPYKKKKPSTTKAFFGKKKDFLTVNTVIRANSKNRIIPKWKQIVLSYKGKKIKPYKTWSERKIIQRNTSIKVRLVFRRPDLPRQLREAFIKIPTNKKTIIIKLSEAL